MVVLRSVQAENLTSCNGVVHLPAGRHTLVAGFNCSACQIVGEPGTVLDAPVSCYGGLTLNGSLVLRGSGQSRPGDRTTCLETGAGGVGGDLVVHGNVSFKDCLNIRANHFLIIGPNSGENMVSVTNSSTDPYENVAVDVKNNAHVIFTDTNLAVGENWLGIENSHVIFERGSVSGGSVLLEGIHFRNSTIIASNTSFGGGGGQFSASNSVLNFTNSTVSIYYGNSLSAISISNCSIDVTCPSNGPVFSTGVTIAGCMGMDIDDSMVRFERCSCHLDHAISVAGPLSIRKGSVTFSMCQTYGGSTKADPVVVV